MRLDRHARRPQSEAPAIIEPLEGRHLLSTASVVPGSATSNDSQTTGNPVTPQVAIAQTGAYVVVWQNDGQDGSQPGIFAQRYDASGIAQAGIFRINSDTVGPQAHPSVAMDSEGDFVIVWSSLSQSGNNSDIVGQRYTAGGAAAGTEFQITSNTTTNQITPSVAMDGAGDFVVTWENQLPNGGSQVETQRYDASGLVRGEEFQVANSTITEAAHPSVAMDAAGGFIVTWQNVGSNGSSQGIDAERFDQAGNLQGGEIHVSENSASIPSSPSVAIDAAGDFVIAWQSVEDARATVVAQRYTVAGLPQGIEILVNGNTTLGGMTPAVAMDSAGDFVVAWATEMPNGGLSSIEAQRYNATGIPRGAELQVSEPTTTNQVFPSVAMNPAGVFVITWESQTQGTGDYAIYTQGYTSDGVTQNGVIQVNTLISNLAAASIMINPALDFANSWQSFAQYGNLNGVYAQYYNTATAAPLGDVQPNTDLLQLDNDMSFWGGDAWGSS